MNSAINMRQKFSSLREKMSPESQNKSQAKTEKLLAEMDFITEFEAQKASKEFDPNIHVSYCEFCKRNHSWADSECIWTLQEMQVVTVWPY